MKIWKMVIASILIAGGLLVSFPNELLGCSEPNSTFIVQEDPLGRMIVLWQDEDAGGSLKVTVDDEKPQMISLPEQHCLSPRISFTKQGDIVVIWAGKIPGKELYSFYGAKLPYKKKWTKAQMLPDEDDLVNLNSHKLHVTDSGHVHVYWESFTFFPSTDNPANLGHQKEIKHLKGTMANWGTNKSHALLRYSP